MPDNRSNRTAGIIIAIGILAAVLLAWCTGQQPHREFNRIEMERSR